MYEALGLDQAALAAGLGLAGGVAGTLGIKGVFLYEGHKRKEERKAHPPAPAPHNPEPAAPASPPAPTTREDWEKHGFGPAIVGAEMIGGFSGRWPPLSEMGKIGNLMTWAVGLGYGLLYGVAITPWTQQPIVAGVIFFVTVMVIDYGLLVPWGIFKPPWKEGHAFYFNLVLYGIYCVLAVLVFWAIAKAIR